MLHVVSLETWSGNGYVVISWSFVVSLAQSILQGTLDQMALEGFSPNLRPTVSIGSDLGSKLQYSTV